MKLADLPLAELQRRLRGPGVVLQTAQFVTQLTSPIAEVARGLSLLYGDYPLADPDQFVDFPVRIAPPRGLRRWLHPQVLFYFDGHPPFKPLPREQAFPMFEWGLNWCVSSFCHQYLVIHAAVIEKQGFAAILPAPPGSGKSTLCAGLIHRGWRLLSDELTLVDLTDGSVVPLARPVSLKNRSIEVIKKFAPETVFSPVVHDTTKGSVAHLRPPADSVARWHERARPGWVIFPRYVAGAPAQLIPHPKARAFMGLAENGFNQSFLGHEGFNGVAALIDACDCYEFSYGDLNEAVRVFAALTPPTARVG